MSIGKCAAGIVAFRPRPDLFLTLVKRLEPEVQALFVFLNGAIDAATLEALRATRAHIIESTHNLGVGEALNQLALHAIWAGYSRLLIFDDDSGPPTAMASALNRAMDSIEAAGKRPAVVGPAIVAPAATTHAYRAPRYFRAGPDAVASARPVRYVISSGSLIDLTAFRKVGRFRSDFFMDAIDTEWCFRAWSRGYSCWVDESVRMEHRIGAGVTPRTILGRGFPRQPPMRLYAYIRNQIYCLRLAHLPLWWRLLSAAHVARLCGATWLTAESKPAAAGLIKAALHDGWQARLGPPPGAQGAASLTTEPHLERALSGAAL